MHDLSFAEAVKPQNPIILRLPMISYSVGHEILLLNQQNPILLNQEIFDKLPFEQKKLAIIRAALVCYRTWKQNHNLEKYLHLWGFLIRKSIWAAEIAEFRNYRTAGSSFPPVPAQEHYEIAAGIEKEKPGRSLGGSYFARMITFLSRGGLYRSIGFETPWDVPFGLANHLYLAELEVDGASRIENEREAQVRQEMEEHQKAVDAENEVVRAAWAAAATDEERRAAVEKHPRILNLFPDSIKFAGLEERAPE